MSVKRNVLVENGFGCSSSKMTPRAVTDIAPVIINHLQSIINHYKYRLSSSSHIPHYALRIPQQESTRLVRLAPQNSDDLVLVTFTEILPPNSMNLNYVTFKVVFIY